MNERASGLPGADPGAIDPQLQQALRHAPDAELSAPPALSASILQQARAAVAGAAQRGAGQHTNATRTDRIGTAGPRFSSVSFGARWASVWAWLGRPRLAAALASLMVISVLGLVVRDRLMDEAFDAAPRPAPSAAPIAPGPAQAPAAAPVPSPVPSPAAAKVATPLAARDPRSAPLPAPGPATSPAPVPAPAVATAQATTTAKATVPESVQPAAPGEAPAATPASPPVLTPPQAQSPSTLAAAPLADAPATGDAGRARASRRPAMPPPVTVAGAPTDAELDTLRAQLQAEGPLWTLRRREGPAQALDTAALAWLQALQLEAQLAGDGAVGRAGQADTEATGSVWLLELLRDGRPRHRFSPVAGGIAWDRPDTGMHRMLALPPPALQRLGQPAAAGAATR